VDETVREARDRYLAENRLDEDGYRASKFPVYVGRRAVWLPNPGFLAYHDLHHVATGFGTGLVGEAEISAYELRAGCRSPLIYLLCVGAIAGALFVAPRRVIGAWRRARGTRTLYYTTLAHETLLGMSVRELRQHLAMPPSGLADTPPVTERGSP
jgi:hypothetical protein